MKRPLENLTSPLIYWAIFIGLEIYIAYAY
jgi:hypothetical protein